MKTFTEANYTLILKASGVITKPEYEMIRDKCKAERKQIAEFNKREHERIMHEIDPLGQDGGM